MIRIERILCPVDFSELSRPALEQAAALARWYGARVTALHVSPWSQVLMATHMPLVPIPTADSLGSVRTDASRELQRTVQAIRRSGACIATHVVSGDPAGEILRHAGEARADMIVMGTHGRRGFSRWFLGSVTESVLRRARCPVLAVCGHEESRGSAVELGTIVCGVDFSDASLRALEYGFSLAQERHSRIVLLHVLASAADDGLFLAPGLAGRVHRQASERLETLIPADAGDWCRAEVSVRLGKPHKEILTAAAEEDADLIVLGSPRKGGLQLIRFGSTLLPVAREAACPVLTVPVPDARPVFERVEQALETESGERRLV